MSKEFNVGQNPRAFSSGGLYSEDLLTPATTKVNKHLANFNPICCYCMCGKKKIIILITKCEHSFPKLSAFNKV